MEVGGSSRSTGDAGDECLGTLAASAALDLQRPLVRGEQGYWNERLWLERKLRDEVDEINNGLPQVCPPSRLARRAEQLEHFEQKQEGRSESAPCTRDDGDLALQMEVEELNSLFP